MWNILLVAAGGAFGATCRHLFSGATLRIAPNLPTGAATFAINVLGSLLMGLLAGWLAFRVDGGQQWRLLLGTGVLGGFTTFSTFSLETALMIERRDYVPAAIYVIASVIVGVVGLFVGLWLARRVFA
jgi:CrcB protein